MKKAIGTGANRFVGTGVCMELSEQGVEVIAIVCNSPPDENILGISENNGIRIVYSDRSDFGRFNVLAPDRDTDVLYHFAWGGNAGSLYGDAGVQMKNIQYTCDAVKACSAMGVND